MYLRISKNELLISLNRFMDIHNSFLNILNYLRIFNKGYPKLIMDIQKRIKDIHK